MLFSSDQSTNSPYTISQYQYTVKCTGDENQKKSLGNIHCSPGSDANFLWVDGNCKENWFEILLVVKFTFGKELFLWGLLELCFAFCFWSCTCRL